MHIETLVGISIFTILGVWTVYSWMDRWQAVSKEGFTPDIDAVIAASKGAPTNADVSLAYQTVLNYIKADFSKGILVVNDFRDRFFPSNTPLKDGFTPDHIMDKGPIRLAPETPTTK